MTWAKRRLPAVMAGLALSQMAASASTAAPLPVERALAVHLGATEPLDRLETDVEVAHPVAMFLLSKRLLLTGRKDEAAFWFFEAQVRWRPFLRHEDAGGQQEFSVLFENLNKDINFYASCDLTKSLATYDRVLAWDASHPDRFVQEQAAKDKTRAEVKEIGDYERDHAEEMRKVHAGRSECAPGTGDPYDGDGPTLGLPTELLTAYDPRRFRDLKVGVTTRSQAVAAIGPPEFWDKADGVGPGSSLGYEYEVPMGAGLARRVRVHLNFDSRKVLARIDLPDEKNAH